MSREKRVLEKDHQEIAARALQPQRINVDKDVQDKIAALKAQGKLGRKAPPRRPKVVDNGD